MIRVSTSVTTLQRPLPRRRVEGVSIPVVRRQTGRQVLRAPRPRHRPRALRSPGARVTLLDYCHSGCRRRGPCLSFGHGLRPTPVGMLDPGIVVVRRNEWMRGFEPCEIGRGVESCKSKALRQALRKRGVDPCVPTEANPHASVQSMCVLLYDHVVP